MRRLFIVFLMVMPAIAQAKGWHYLLKSIHVRVEESGLSHVTTTVKVKIDGPEGIKRFSVLRLDYDPATNLVKYKNAVIIHKDHTKTYVPIKACKDLPQPQRWIYWGTRMKVLPVMGLKVGDILEWTTYKKGFTIAYLDGNNSEERYIPPMRGHYYDVVTFGGDAKIDKMIYTLELPKDKQIQYKVYNGSLSGSRFIGQNHIIWQWVGRNLKAIPHEAMMAEPHDFVTKLVLTTIPDWQTKSRWFYNVNKDQFNANKAIKQKVNEILKGAKTEDEKAKRLLRWVARNIRYAGLNMGKGEGYTLHPGTMTFHDRCGVCKDIAGMLITMMKAAGFEVYPAMTMAGERVEAVPADQFNHCVVAWRKSDHTFEMLDPTWAPFSRLLWCNAEFNQDFLIGTPWGESLMQTPYVPPVANTMKIVEHSVIDKDGNLKTTIKIKGFGFADTRIRRLFVYTPKNEWTQLFKKIIADVSPGAKLLKWKVGNLEDLNTPIEVMVSFEVPHWAVPGKKFIVTGVAGARPLFRFNKRFTRYLSATLTPKRKSPIWMWSTWKIDIVDNITLPVSVKDLSLKGEKQGYGATLKYNFKAQGNKIIFKETYAFSKREIPASKYRTFKSVVDKIRGLSNRVFILKVAK